MKKRVLLISGISGAGKDWLVNKLSTETFEKVRTSTTRTRRNEYDFYNFLSETEMDVVWPSFIQRLESAGYRYGASEEPLKEIHAKGKIPAMIVSPSGVYDMLDKLSDSEVDYEFFYVHIKSDEELTLFNMTARRKDETENVIKRILHTDVEIRYQFEEFLDFHSLNFINRHHNFEIADSSDEALEMICEHYGGEL